MIEAGFDVTGIDIHDHSASYPGHFVQGDVCMPPVTRQGWTLVWASPPCQMFSVARTRRATKPAVNLIPETRRLLEEFDAYTVIENVPNAPIRADIRLSGPMLGLRRIVRTRHFETNFYTGLWPPFSNRYQCLPHQKISPSKRMACPTHWYPRKAIGLPGQPSNDEVRSAMGITNQRMTREELGETIPPSYAQIIGTRILRGEAHRF